MGNLTVIVLVVVGAIWGLSLFLGYMGNVRKNLDAKQKIQSVNSAELKEKQKQIAEEAEEQRKRFMEDVKYKTQNQPQGF